MTFFNLLTPTNFGTCQFRFNYFYLLCNMGSPIYYYLLILNERGFLFTTSYLLLFTTDMRRLKGQIFTHSRTQAPLSSVQFSHKPQPSAIDCCEGGASGRGSIYVFTFSTVPSGRRMSVYELRLSKATLPLFLLPRWQALTTHFEWLGRKLRYNPQAETQETQTKAETTTAAAEISTALHIISATGYQ